MINIKNKLEKHVYFLKSNSHKICNCKHKSMFYNDGGMYKCQYCDGLLTDLKRVEEIIKSNTIGIK